MYYSVSLEKAGDRRDGSRKGDLQEMSPLAIWKEKPDYITTGQLELGAFQLCVTLYMEGRCQEVYK